MKVRVFCGPARATVRFRGKTYTFRNGGCVRTARSLSLNIGTEWLPFPSAELPRTSWFGAIVNTSRDGTFHPGTGVFLSWTAPGLSVILTAGTLRLSGNRTSGTFSGQVAGRDAYTIGLTTGVISGSFSC